MGIYQGYKVRDGRFYLSMRFVKRIITRKMSDTCRCLALLGRVFGVKVLVLEWDNEFAFELVCRARKRIVLVGGECCNDDFADRMAFVQP